MTFDAGPPTTVADRVGWILACGCEPMIEHCTQCDARRLIIRDLERAETLGRMADELRAAGYTVTAPDDPLDPPMVTEDGQPFRDWVDFVERVARPIVNVDGDLAAVMALYRKASPYFICTALVMAHQRAYPPAPEPAATEMYWILNPGGGVMHARFANMGSRQHAPRTLCGRRVEPGWTEDECDHCKRCERILARLPGEER